MTVDLHTAAHLELRTPQLVLRLLSQADVDALSELLLSPGVGAYMALRTATSEDIRDQLASRVGSGCSPDQMSFTFAIHAPDHSDPVGMVTVAREQVPHRVIISDLVIDPRHTRAGYGLEAGRAAIAFAFALPGVRRVWALRHHENAAGTVLFQGVGMTEEGLLRGWLELDGRLVDVFAHSILRDEWYPTEHEHAVYLRCRSAMDRSDTER